MGVASSSDEASGMASPSILSKVSVKGGKADMDAFMTEGRVDNVQIGYVTKKQHERFNPRNINRRVVLTHSTIKRVKRNWAMISEGPDAKGGGLNSSVTPLVVLYDTFFGRLFMLDPSMRAMFEDNMIRQSKFLVGLVNIIVKMEDMLKQDLTPVYSFADHSVAMGARPEHYEIIASVLPFALESCAEERAWTNSVAEAWKDVMSFAILAVVERTVESWLGRGTSLSEMWHTLSDWRTHSRNLPSPSSSTPSLPTPERVRVTRNPVATRPLLGSNSSGGLPEAPPRLLYRGAPPDPLQAGRPPGATESRSFSNADNKCSGLTAATADDGNINIGSPRCDEDGRAAGRRPHHPWARRISTLTTSTSTATAALSTAQSADQDLDVACNLNACVLSDGEPDGLSSNNSGDVDVDFDGGAFGSGSGTGVRKGSLKNAVVGVLHVSGGGEGNGSRSRSPPPPQQRKETKFSPSKVSYNRVGRSATDGSVALARSMASIRRPESASLDPSMALDDASRVIDNQERRLSNRSVSVHADHEEYHHLGAIVTGASTTAASRASVAAKGTVVEGAGAGGGGVIGGGAGGVSGGHRSSLNILRRKKITRSASLEDDDEISHRRHSVLSRASQDLKGGRGGGSSSSTRALQDLTGVKESGGMLRGKGRDGSLALTAGYVRSQSVTDELLPADRHDSSRFDRSMTRFDLGGDLPSHLDQHTRRRGLVSRMRRTASNVIRFRSSSRPLESSCDHGREHGHGQSHHTANAQHATHRQNSHGGIGLGVGIGRQNTHQQVRVRSYGSDMGLGADGLRVSSASPASTAVPTPAAATPPLDVNSTVVKKTGSEPSHRAPRDDRCHNGVPRMAGSVEHAWTVSHGNQGYKKPFSPPRPLPGQALMRERASQSGPVLTGFGGFGGEKTAFAYYFSLSESEQEAQRSARQHQQEQHQHQQQQRRQQLEQQQQQRYQQQQRHQQQEQKQRHHQQQQRYQQQEQQQRHQQQQGHQQEMQKGMKQGSGEGDRVDGGNGAIRRLSSGASVSTLRDRTTERDNPWRQMKLHELMAKLEDSSAGETERNFGDIAEAILCHLGPSEPPTTRALALDVAQTFVQNVLSERSKDRKSSKIRRKAFKEFLMHVVPLVLDCLKSLGRNNLSSRSAENGSTTKGASAETSGEIEPASSPPASASAAAAAAAAGVASAVASTSIGTGTSSGTGKTTGDVVVLHYYQQHHQYVLRVTALETMSRFLTVLRALFRPPHSTRVQKAVAPLLDADEEVLRDRAAAVLGKLSLCGKDSLKWANVAIKVSLEAHNLLHDAWPDESAGQIPSSEVESIMGEHPLLPAIHDTFAKGDPEAHVMALGRRFPALCKLLATLVTVSPPKSNDANMSTEDGVQTKPDEGGESSPTPLAPPPYQIPFLAKLSISLVQRVLRMGGQAWAILEDERTGVRRNDSCSPDGATLVKSSAQHHKGASNDTLTPELAARVSDLLLPSVVNLLDALVSSSKLEHVMEEHQAVVCRCMAQAVAQMPVQGGMRFAAYRSMALVIRYTQPGCAALELGVPMLPLLFNEALLALGNTVSLYPVSHKTVSSVRAVTEELSGISTPEVAFNVRTPVNNGHGVKLHHDTVGAGVECLAELVLISGHFLPPAQIAEVERVVTEGVELLATRPLEVSPFNEDEPQVLRHASTREAFVKLVHFYLVLAEEKGRNPGSTLYSEAKAAFLCHLQDPDGAVARECGRALTALKAEGIDQKGHHDHGDHHGSQRGEDRSVDRRKPHKPNEPHKERPLEDMEAEADKGHHASNAEAGYVLEELDTGEYHVVRCADKVANKRSPARVPKAVL